VPGQQARSTRGRDASMGRQALAEIGEGSGQEEGVGPRASRAAWRKPRTARLQFWSQVSSAVQKEEEITSFQPNRAD
jgi:hypothetical protein